MKQKIIFYFLLFVLFFSAGSFTSKPKNNLPKTYTGKPFKDEIYKGDPQTIPGRMQCALFDLGGEGIGCTRLFEKYVTITNYPENTIGNGATEVIPLLAGDEQYSSPKTYINTLLSLFIGFGFNTEKAVELLDRKMPVYQQLGEKMATEVFELITHKKIMVSISLAAA